MRDKTMPTPEDINKLLCDCCEALVDCSSAINDMPLEPRKKNIYRIGKALAEVSEIRSELYAIHPELKPEGWDSPPSEEEFEEMFSVAKKQAEEYLEAGRFERAIETYESYLFIGPSERFEAMAREALEKVKQKHGA